MAEKNPTYRYQCCSNLSFPQGLHKHCEIISVSEGEMNILINKTKIVLSEGMGIFIPGYVNHGFETLKTSVCHIWEYSDSLITDRFSREVLTFDFPVETQKYLHNLNDASNILTCKAIIYLAASHFCSKTPQTHKVELNDICSKTALFIAENFDKSITLKDAAEYCNVSYSYLSKLFCKNIGVSFTACLNNTRISKCLYMLTESDIPITDIAMACGFGTLRNFNRVFFEQLSCTPAEFRKFVRNK